MRLMWARLEVMNATRPFTNSSTIVASVME